MTPICPRSRSTKLLTRVDLSSFKDIKAISRSIVSVEAFVRQGNMASLRRRLNFTFCALLSLIQILQQCNCTSISTIGGPAGPYPLKSRFNKLRHVTLKDDAFCEAYQEFRDGNCIAKLTDCSPLDDEQVLKMRQVLCGPRFNGKIRVF